MISGATDQDVVGRRARQAIGARAADQQVAAGTAQELVVGWAAKKDVVADFTGGTEPGTTSSGSATTKAELDAYIKEMEEKLSSVGDDAQLANVDLQNMLQKQQQTIQMMSNISKMLHDTAMAVIRKIG